MAEDVGLSRKTVKVDGVDVLLTEPLGLVPVMCEAVVEVRTLADGNYAITLGAYVIDENNAPEVRVSARLRVTPQALGLIGRLIDAQRELIAAQTAELKKAAN